MQQLIKLMALIEGEEKEEESFSDNVLEDVEDQRLRGYQSELGGRSTRECRVRFGTSISGPLGLRLTRR